MPTQNTRTGYQFNFQQGDDGWGDDVDAFADTLAVDVPDSGPITDRPAPDAENEPKRWYAADEGVEYISDGSTWTPIDSLPYRRLSTFPTVQAAVDWSASNGPTAATVLVDGRFETDESTIELPTRVSLVGGGWMDSEIVATASLSTPFFEYPDGINTMTNFSNVKFKNEGPGDRPFFKCAVSPEVYSGFQGPLTRWENVWLANWGGVYPVDVINCWGGSFSNVYLRTKFSQPTGHFRFHNCNAFNCDGLRSLFCESTDGETPVVYIVGNAGSHYSQIHIEHCQTDAVIQISRGGSRVSLNGLHVEPHTRDVNCGIQIGDGGLSAGNTNGENQQPNVAITAGVIHGNNSAPIEGIRLLGGRVTVTGLEVGNGSNGVDQYLHYGGSNHDTVSTTPQGALLMSADSPTVTNNSGGPANVTVDGGQTYASDTDAANAVPFERFWIDDGTGSVELARKREGGTIDVWAPARQI